MADTTAPSSTRLVDRIDRRVLTAAGLLIAVLILLAIAIPGLTGETPWDGELGVASLPPEARASTVIDLDAEVPHAEVAMTVHPPADWEPGDPSGWHPRPWVSLNLAQFGRFIHATGAPPELVDTVFATPGQQFISSTVPIEGITHADTGARAQTGYTSREFGAIRRLTWSSGTAFDSLEIGESGPAHDDPAFVTAMVELMEGTLDAAAVPHRNWAMRITGVDESPYAELQLYPAVPPTGEGDDNDAHGLLALPGITVSIVTLADGSHLVSGFDGHIGRWAHPDFPSDLPEGFDPDAARLDIADLPGDPGYPIRFAPSGPSPAARPGSVLDGDIGDPETLAEGIGVNGLGDLVAVDPTADDPGEGLDALPPSLCRDVPTAAVQALLPGNYGPDFETDNFELIDTVPFTDTCTYQTGGGFIQLAVIRRPAGTPLPSAGGIYSLVERVGGAVVSLLDQADPANVGLEIAWEGSELRIEGFGRLEGDPEFRDRMADFARALAAAVPADRLSGSLGEITVDYGGLSGQ